ncbi:hypothetical protein FNF29_02556 [Cafeteria roenbergensis]|uniref:Uncharacterized protein n=1 Tax=Cafeteria roenbergensis TaxID=33653 RepID=A0A5A8CML5_CAFRO|nr:hypothetical protein FNF29_02556 [Cafeteria roenbergensis]|eukprot:KAA0154336.1 hypothetical protein FNF29_02556 [Cafeteria roenbergensis]
MASTASAGKKEDDYFNVDVREGSNESFQVSLPKFKCTAAFLAREIMTGREKVDEKAEKLDGNSLKIDMWLNLGGDAKAKPVRSEVHLSDFHQSQLPAKVVMKTKDRAEARFFSLTDASAP